MKKAKFLAIGLLVYLFIGLFFLPRALAAPATQSAQTNITVTISGNVFTASGYLAPFASITLTINNAVITSTVADAAGNFSFASVNVPKTTSSICFDGIDFKKLGESEACISVTPVNGQISKTGIFLPPTLGVFRTDVNVGDSALLFGYGMPGASITVHLNAAAGCTTTADKTGYYQCNIQIAKAGSNELYADAVLQNKPSEQQLKKVLINGISLIKTTPVPTKAPITLPSFPGLFQIPWWIWLLLVLIAIILIIILLRKYRPELAAPGIPTVKVNHLFDFLFRERKLHHSWMKGVGY